jgi:hypothetical protein
VTPQLAVLGTPICLQALRPVNNNQAMDTSTLADERHRCRFTDA